MSFVLEWSSFIFVSVRISSEGGEDVDHFFHFQELRLPLFPIFGVVRSGVWLQRASSSLYHTHLLSHSLQSYIVVSDTLRRESSRPGRNGLVLRLRHSSRVTYLLINVPCLDNFTKVENPPEFTHLMLENNSCLPCVRFEGICLLGV